jgi:hypothetical protein
LSCEIDVIAASCADQVKLIRLEPDEYEIHEFEPGSDEFVIVFKDAFGPLGVFSLIVVPDDQWPFGESRVVGIAEQAQRSRKRFYVARGGKDG